jgi:hypothetical protein
MGAPLTLSHALRGSINKGTLLQATKMKNEVKNLALL